MRANVTMSRREWPEPDSVTSGFRENMVCWEFPFDEIDFTVGKKSFRGQ